MKCYARKSQYTTGLYAQPDDFCSKEDGDSGDDDDDDAEIQNNMNVLPTAISSSTSRRQRLRKYLSRVSKTLLLASTLTLMAPKQAEAKFAHEVTEEEKTLSLRPGVSQTQAEQLNEGEIPDDLPDTPKTFLNQEQPKASEIEKKKAAAKKKAFDYGDEEDDDEDDLLFEEEYMASPSKTSPGRTSVSQADVQRAKAFQAGTKSSFSGVATKSETEKRTQTLKVAVGAFIPTFGAMFVREFVRRRKEEKYVQKGLEILEAQKAEYFNITNTTAADSDIEDELKDLKDGEDDDDDDEDSDDEDDDDDDEDDDDDDEDDEPPSRRRPKRPTGGGGSGGAGGSSGSSGDGDGRPSEEDLKRLGDIFDKS